MPYRPPTPVALGRAVRDIRLERGLTQQQLGEGLGVGRARVGHVEQGRNLTFETLRALSAHLDLPLQDLLTRADAHEAELQAARER